MSGKTKKRSRSDRACICAYPACKKTTAAFLAAGDEGRGRYLTVPAPAAKRRDSGAGKRRKSGTRDDKVQRRKRTLLHLGGVEPADKTTKLFFSAVHLNPALAKRFKAGKVEPTISAADAAALNPPWKHDVLDITASGNVLVVPNYPWADTLLDLAALLKPRKAQLSAENRSLRPVVASIAASAASSSDGGGAAAAALECSLQSRYAELLALLKAEHAAHELTKEELASSRMNAESGQNKKTLTSVDWHDRHPGAATHIFGFRSFSIMVAYAQCWWPWLVVEMSEPGKNLTSFERFCVAMQFGQMGRDEMDLALTWGVSPATISRILTEWAPRFEFIGKAFCRNHVTLEFCKKSQPAGMEERYGMPMSGSIDGTDYPADTVRISPLVARLAYHNKNHDTGGRQMMWGFPGTGMCLLATDMFFSRVEEERLVELHKRWLGVFPKGTGLLKDRGFPNGVRHYPNFNPGFLPTFMNGRAQMHGFEVRHSRRVAKDRYTQEVFNARVKSMKILKGRIPRRRFRYMNAYALFACAKANLYKPLVEPADWKDYLENQIKNARAPLV